MAEARHNQATATQAEATTAQGAGATNSGERLATASREVNG